MNSILKFGVSIYNRFNKVYGLLGYLLLAFSLYLNYENFKAINLISEDTLLVVMLVLGVLSVIKPVAGCVCFVIVYSCCLIPVNYLLTVAYLFIAFVLMIGIAYEKNDIIFISIIYILLACDNNLVIFSFAICLYYILFVQRGFGIPFYVSLIITGTSLFTTNFLTESIYNFPARKKIPKDIVAYLTKFFANEEIPTKTMELLKTNGVALFIILFLCYVFFKAIKVKSKSTDIDINEEYRLSVFSALFSFGLISSIIVILSLYNQVEIPINNIYTVGMGVGLGFITSIFAVRYPDAAATPALQSTRRKESDVSSVATILSKNSLNVSWDSIAGYEDVKKELKDIIEPYKDHKIMDKMKKANINPVKGILLFGPPGSGKTLFAKVLAAESGMNIISVAGSEFTSKWVGETDKNLRNIFKEARMKAPCVIFFDELESFLPHRDSVTNTWEKSAVTTFLSQMDGFNDLNNVIVVGATNYPDIIDSAAIRPGRFDKCIYISEPDVEAKKSIIGHYLMDNNKLSDEDIQVLAEKLERYTAADISGLIKEAYRQNEYKPLTVDYILSASKQYNPTVTLAMRDRYEKLQKQYTRRFTIEDENKVKEKKYSWEDIAGMEEEKDRIRKLVEKPLLHADLYEELGLELPKGILMFGPPGCGKTLFAKVIAAECDASFHAVNGPELLSGQIGQSEEKLRTLFRMAREQKPSIIFFDEFDSIATDRSQNQNGVKLINQLLTELDGMNELKGVIVLAATNRIHEIDSALKRPGRFNSILYIGLPDLASREKQFEYHLQKIKNIDCHKLAELSEKFSCADIKECCRKIKEKQLEAILENVEFNVSQQDCENIVKTTSPTLNDQEILFYESLKNMKRF